LEWEGKDGFEILGNGSVGGIKRSRRKSLFHILGEGGVAYKRKEHEGTGEEGRDSIALTSECRKDGIVPTSTAAVGVGVKKQTEEGGGGTPKSKEGRVCVGWGKDFRRMDRRPQGALGKEKLTARGGGVESLIHRLS